MARVSKDKVVRKVYVSFAKGADLNIRVSTVEVDGAKGVEIFDYIPSTRTVSRGLIVPRHLTQQLIDALQKIVADD